MPASEQISKPGEQGATKQSNEPAAQKSARAARGSAVKQILPEATRVMLRVRLGTRRPERNSFRIVSSIEGTLALARDGSGSALAPATGNR